MPVTISYFKGKKNLFSFSKSQNSNHSEMKYKHEDVPCLCGSSMSVFALASTLLFQGVFWTLAAALLRVPHSRLSQKVPEDGIFHNKEAHLWFQPSDVLWRSSPGGDQCLRTCIRQVAAQKTNRKWRKTEATSAFLGGKRNKLLPRQAAVAPRSPHRVYRFLSVSGFRHTSRGLALRALTPSLRLTRFKIAAVATRGFRSVCELMQSFCAIATPPRETSAVLWSAAKHLHGV